MILVGVAVEKNIKNVIGLIDIYKKKVYTINC